MARNRNVGRNRNMGRERNWFLRALHLSGGGERNITESSRARSGLNDLISADTQGLVKNWPWTNCVAKLSNKGYFISFHPSATVSFTRITSRCSHISEFEARKINNDLASGYIRVIRGRDPQLGPV